MSDPIIRRWRDRTVLRILLIPVFFILPIGIFACLAVFGFVGGELFGGREAGTFFFVFGLICFVLVGVGGAVAAAVYFRRRSHGMYNEIFEGLGLQGSSYLFSGRKFQGSHGGRQVNVYVYASGSRYNRRPVMELFVEAPVGGRMGIGTKNVLSNVAAGLLNKEELEGTGLEGVGVYADDKSWATTMLDASGVRDAVRSLMEPMGSYEIRVVNYMPDSIRLQISNFTAEVATQNYIRRVFDELVILASAIDDGPRPREIIEPTQSEVKSRTDRSAYMPIACGVVAVIMLGVLAVAVCSLVFIFVIENGGL